MATRRRKAGTSRIGLTVDVSGPFFERAVREGVIDRFLTETKREIAQQGVDELQAATRVFKQPSGAYRRHITERAARSDNRVITDQGIIYGPWLEGTSSRNRSSRFKGYKLFRKARLRLRRKVTPIAQANLDKYIGQLS